MQSDEHSGDGEGGSPGAGTESQAVHLGGAQSTEEAVPIDFSAFVLSLAQTAMIDMGVAPHPEGGYQPPDWQAASQTIDLLAMLEEKTAGNLKDEEHKLLEGTLYQLRMSFIEAKKKA